MKKTFFRYIKKKYFLFSFPFSWLLLFFFIPFLFILKISFTQQTLGIPPYTKILFWDETQFLKVKLYLGNFTAIFRDWFYGHVFLSSLRIALTSTFFCLLIGYPIAYAISRASSHLKVFLTLLVVLPFGTSFLIRVYAWMSILSDTGIINHFLMSWGMISTPVHLLHSEFAMIIGIVYCYLPFMILPIYSVLDKIDFSLIEASYDLGCRPFRTFWKIVFPLSQSGIIAGSILVFIPSVGEFVIPELLGGTDSLMIGRVLWSEFFTNRDWPLACALAIIMLIVFITPFMFFQRTRVTEEDL